ncbi:MAG: hypothetical protein A2231_03135 [Candidatus Firestonebacteria bacterium RIFOXYA2_FULL_40_8]|nr:MAG: hypothetical protein A2231_03135 [Candidatus Firestonebacteria bacterium RIFOXYA2_FULL_40_8]
MDKRYAVLRDAEYYGGDVQHPQGWEITVAILSDEEGETICIGTLDECSDWMGTLDDERHELSHGMAGYHYRIAEVLDDNAEYNHWTDAYVSWDGCPEGDDQETNCAWAEDEAYNNDGILYIANPTSSYGIIVDLSTEI